VTDDEVASVYAHNVKALTEEHPVDTAGLRAVADAAVGRVLDRIEGERRYWDPRDAHRDLDDLIREMREELDRGDG
jgi:hypothetical protein